MHELAQSASARSRRLTAAFAALALVGTAIVLQSCGSDGPSSRPERAAAAPAGGCAPMPSQQGQQGADDRSFALAPLPLCAAGSKHAPADPHELDLAALIPRGRVRQAWFLHGGRLSDQVLVEWIDQGRPALEPESFRARVRWGLSVWQRAGDDRGARTVWSGAVIPVLRPPPAVAELDVSVGDVTGDGHPDLLIAQYPGTNHGCGPHQVIAALPARGTWRLFGGAPMCETAMTASRGLLKVVSPIYRRGDSVCCPTFTATTYRRWSGDRFLTIRTRRTRNHD